MRLRILLSIAVIFAAGRASASFPLEEQRVASVMEARLQDSLDRVFGSGRSAVSVFVSLKTDPRVARRVDEALGGAELGPSGRFEWTWGTKRGAKARRYVLPGIPDAKKASRSPSGLSVEAAAALAKRTSRLSVTVILDDSLPSGADARATELVARTVDLDQTRGDLLEVARSPMPKPATGAPGPVSAVFLWACLLVFAASAAAAFYFFERWLRRPPAPAPVPALPAPRPRAPEKPREPPPPLPGDVLSRVRAPFQIPLSDASKLFFLLRKESAEDIALVLPHLLPPTRKALLAYFSEDEAARAVEASTRFRVVDPELIVLLKAELERRVAALHGGPEAAVRLLDDAEPQDRDRILKALERFEPHLARAFEGSERPAPASVPPVSGFEDLTAPAESPSPPAFEEEPPAPPPEEKKDDDDPPRDAGGGSGGGGVGPFPDGSGAPPTPQLSHDEDIR
jgi:hypothetical protein